MGMPEEAYTQGIRANLDQFVHQVVQVFLVGLLIGMERNILPSMATRNFGVAENSFLFLLTFVLGFGLVKGALNFVAGTLADRIGRKPVLLMGWLVALPIPFVLLFARNWWWVVFANMLLGINQGFAWSMTVTSKVDITRTHQRGAATGINETAGYLAVGVAGVATGYLASRFGSRETLFGFGLAVILSGLTLAIFSEDPPRSGRPTAPTNRVSPVSKNQGSSPLLRSVTKRQRLSGVCPGVWRIRIRTFPSPRTSPSRRG